jgi:hypothetical protein
MHDDDVEYQISTLEDVHGKYAQERAIWETKKAMSVAPKSKAPRWAKILNSSVIYR